MEFIPAWSDKFKPSCDNCQWIFKCRNKVYGTSNVIVRFVLYLQLKANEKTMSCKEWKPQDVMYYARFFFSPGDLFGKEKPPMKMVDEESVDK